MIYKIRECTRSRNVTLEYATLIIMYRLFVSVREFSSLLPWLTAIYAHTNFIEMVQAMTSILSPVI